MIDAQTPLPGDQIRALIHELQAQKDEALDRIAADRQRVAEIDAALPELDALAAKLVRNEVSERRVPDEDENDPGPKHLKASVEVRQAVRGIVQSLPFRCGLSEIEEALDAADYAVNQSTLRKNLNEMARQGDTFQVVVEGKGRRATVYQKIETIDLLAELARP